MNIQAMMKQAQQMQKDMVSAKKEIDNTLFEKQTSFLKIQMNGKKEILSVKLDVEKIEKDEIEIVEDLIQVTINDLIKKIDNETENKLGKFTKGMPGLF
jgi:nucleoid-associated protein EbfC